MLRYKTETRPGLVALYDIRPGNGAGPFLQPRSPHGATSSHTYYQVVRIICLMSGFICLWGFICLFIFLPCADIIMTSLQYFVCYTSHGFQLWRWTFGTALNNTQSTHPLTSGAHKACMYVKDRHFEHTHTLHFNGHPSRRTWVSKLPP